VEYSFSAFEDFARIRESLRLLLLSEDPREGGWLYVALNEAMNNAFSHGPLGGEVRLSLFFGPDRIEMRVRDEGPGFDWRSRFSAPEPPPADGEGRRGLWILHHILDRVSFDRLGSEILMVKHRIP
jgi:anti-sigma regulatory factor (Ser/Thr protein kinase)